MRPGRASRQRPAHDVAKGIHVSVHNKLGQRAAVHACIAVASDKLVAGPRLLLLSAGDDATTMSIIITITIVASSRGTRPHKLVHYASRSNQSAGQHRQWCRQLELAAGTRPLSLHHC